MAGLHCTNCPHVVLQANPEFKKFPKLPMSVFRDYRPEGPLLLIAKAFWAHMQARTQGKRIPFEVPINRREVYFAVRVEMKC